MSAQPPSSPLATPAVSPGDVVGGFRVERVLRDYPGSWTVAEGRRAAGERPGPGVATLWISAPGAADDPALAARFERLGALRERRDAADLPLVVPEAAVRDGSRLVLARALPRGTSLAERLREGPLPREEAVRLVSQIAGALDTLRVFKLPHAPLTPERILLTERRPTRALLHDFGFALPPAPACSRASLLADVDYLAPEVARGEPASAAGDVYALACVLVACLTSVPPFPYDQPLLVLHAHAVQPPPAIAEAAGLPPELDRVLRTALDKLPEHRQRTAASLARAAQRALGRQRPPIPVAVPEAPPRAAARPASPPAPKAAPGERARRARSRPAPPRREAERSWLRRRWPVPSGAGVVVALVAASTAGFATARMRTDTVEHPPPRGAATAPADQGAVARAAYARRTARVVRRLDADRARGRAALRAARGPGGQAHAADLLARAYGRARQELASAPAGMASPEGALRRTQAAYRRLASAARSADGTGYRAAAADVRRRERELARALAKLTGSGSGPTA